MKLILRTFLAFIGLILMQHKASASIELGDSIIYQQVVDSLIQVAVRVNQLHPIVFISESKRFKANTKDIDVCFIIRQFAADSLNYMPRDENIKTLRNKQLKKILLTIGPFERSAMPLPKTNTPAQISYKSNGWKIFDSFSRIKNYRKKHPEFFCVADITAPVFSGDYAVVVVDRQFNPLGGGGYMHIFQKVNGKWQTYALVNLWNY